MMNFILLQAQGEQNVLPNILMMVGIIVIFYFFMIRPQMKRQKKEKQFRDNLKKDDKVILIGGEWGRITHIDDRTVTVEIADNIRVKYDKTAVRELQRTD